MDQHPPVSARCPGLMGLFGVVDVMNERTKEKKQMKAIQFTRYGEPAQVLTVQDLPLPEPGEGEVRVRILASPVNPSDLLFVRGHYAGAQPQFPFPVGFEGIG